MNEEDAAQLLADVDLVACLQAPLPEAKELREACLAAGIPALLSGANCCGSGGCGCAPKLALYARAEDVPRIAHLMQRRWQELALREGTVAEDSPFVTGDTACPACGTAAPLVNGACTDCGLAAGIAHHFRYARNLPCMVTFTRSPFGSGSFSTSISKSIALMMPSPNFSWISSFSVVP